MELSIKTKGSIPRREVQKIIPICNNDTQKESFLLQTIDKKLYALQWKDNKLQELTSKPLENFEKVISIIPNASLPEISTGSPLILLKTPSGIEFYELNLTNGEFKLLDVDTKFEYGRDWENQPILGGQFYFNKTVSILTARDTENIRIFLLKKKLGEGNPFSRKSVKLPEELSSAEQVWVTKSGCSTTTTEGEFEPDWISAKYKDHIYSYKFTSEEEITKVGSLKLPNDLKDSVDHIEFNELPGKEENKCQNLIVFFKEQVALIYELVEDTKDFQHRGYFYGDNSTLSSSCSKKKSFAVTGGPTIRPFQDTSVSDIPVRYSGDLLRSAFVFDKDNSVWLFGNSNDSDELLWYHTEIKKIPDIPYIKPNKTMEEGKFISEIPMVDVYKLKFDSRPTLNILDGISSKTFTEAVNMQTGGIGFDMKLISEIGFGIQYTTQSVGLDGPPTIGQDGWSTASPNYIAIDRKSDNLDAEAKYYLILDSTVNHLEFKDVTNDGKQIYKIVNSKMTQEEIDSIVVTYEDQRVCWTVDTKTSKLTFGLNTKAIKWGWQFRSWKETEDEALVKTPSEWYLTEYKKKQQDPTLQELTLLYDYFQVLDYTEDEDESKRKEYTEAVQLVKVQSENSNEINVAFKYGENRQLQSYDAQVRLYKQNVKFFYDNNQRLKEIQQHIGSKWESMIQFNYDEFSGRVSSANVPSRKLEVIYQTEILKINGPEEKTLLTIEDAPGNRAFGVGHGISLSVFGTSKSLYAVDSADGQIRQITELGNLGNPNVEDLKQQRIVISKNCVIRHTEVSSGNRVSIYCFDPKGDPKWKFAKEQNFHTTDVKITSDGTIVTFDKSGLIEIFQWDFKTSDIKSIHQLKISSGQQPALFEASDYIITWYEKNYISWIVKTFTGWSSSSFTQKVEPKDDCFETFKNKFDLGPKSEEIISPLLKSIKFQLRENAMAVMSCTLDESSWMLNTHVDLLAVDRTGKSAFYRNYKVEQDDLRKLKKTADVEGQKNPYTFTYAKEDGKFLIEVSDGDKDHTKELTKNFRESQAKDDQRMILFDFSNYFSSFASKSIYQIGNSTQILHNGAKWEVNKEFNANDPSTIKLGKQFKLEKTEKDKNIQLIEGKNNRVIQSFTKDSNTLYPYYPGYIASIDAEVNKNNTEVLFFYRDANGQEITSTDTLKKEVVQSSFSTAQYLVTNFPERESKYNIRLTGWRENMEVPVVGSVHIKGINLDRFTKYEYHKFKMTQARQINFGEASIIGGGDKSKFGSLKYSFDLTQQYPKAYDGNGEFIEELTPDDDNKEPKKNSDPPTRSKTTLYDKVKLKPITDLSPFEPQDCQIGYFGFEDYESPKLGSACSWNFSERRVVRSGMALTGNSFLRLEKAGDSISIDLPLKKDQSYSISTWVRCLNSSAEVISSILQVKIPAVEGVNWVSKILMTKGDWSYLQIKLYSHELKPFWEKVLGKEPLADNQKIKVEVQRSANSGEVDVDHVIFSPVTWNAEIFVYSEDQVIQNILGNTGLIVYKVFDGTGDAVCKTNGLGQVNRIQFDLLDTDKDNLLSLVQLESFVDPGWIQGFQHDSLVKFSPDVDSFKVFQNGLQYSNFSKESSFSLNIDEYDSFALRFSYTFLPEKSHDSVIKLDIFGSEYTLKSDEHSQTKLVSTCGEFTLEPSGFFVIGFFPENRTFIWGPHSLLCDFVNSSSNVTSSIKKGQKPTIYLKGNVLLENMIILPNPSLKITYSNTILEEIQVLNFVNGHTVNVHENHYDAMGRFQARTKDTLIEVKPSESLMRFRPDFLKKIDVEKQQLEGEANELNPEDKGTPFTSVIFENGPLEDLRAEGRPGPEYSATGSFGTKYSKEPHIRLIKLFPPKDGFKFKVKTNRGGYSEIMIMNSDDIVIAHAAITAGAKHLLATYDYDDKGRVIASLPPQYHEQEGTIDKSKTWKSIGYSTDALFGTFYQYDDQDRLVFKSDPDAGTFDYIFNNSTGNPTHALHKRSKQDAEYDSVVYFEYGANEGALLTEIGEVAGFTSSFTKDALINKSSEFPRTSLKKIEHLGSRNGPLRQTQRVITKNKGNADFIQELDYELPHGNLVADTQIVPSDPEQPAVLISTGFTRSLDGEKILKINYASDDIALGYSYNLLGQISEIYLTKGDLEPVTVARYEYTPNGQISKEVLLEYNTGRSRQLLQPIQTNINFNSPGYAVTFSNPFFSQSINYEDNGYGDLSTGEPGYPSSVTFENFWAEKTAIINPEILEAQGLPKLTAEICHNSLHKLGYVDDNSRILKLFRTDQDMETLPVICSETNGRRISTAFSKVFMEKKKYTYNFQYGNHKELIKIKFFDSDKEINSVCSNPLTSAGLSAALKINEDTGKNLWENLTKNGFISEDKEKGQSHTIQGMSDLFLLNDAALSKEFKDLDRKFEKFGKFVANSLGKRAGSAFNFDEFSKIFHQWNIGQNGTETAATKIYQLLEGNGYLSNNVVQSKIFNEGFPPVVKSLGLDLAKVFSELSAFFACQIGKNTFDYKVFDMDYNGNPKLFWNGFERMELNYKKNTNQIESLSSFSDGKQIFSHDAYGNVNSIRDKNDSYLLKIDYDQLTSRPLKMELKDGRKLFFRYDYKGERVSKQVYAPNGKLEQEIKYLGRDSKSRVLVEQEITYVSENIPPKVTTTELFYGPRGLFAFRRNGKFFNVLLDNIGSTRMVLRNGQVVASYNYLPYGQLASHFTGTDPDGDIRYRFTGQEFDTETGLYNFHFRIYDPVIGRFYQIDPEEIFYSPYKYVGNAPIIFVDPDGREPIFIITCIVLAIVGAYLGGAAANKSWNPAKWNFKDPSTYIGIVVGALAGGFLLPGAGASFAALGPIIGTTLAAKAVSVAVIVSLGTAVAYLNTASAMQSWDPTEWDWKSPELYSAAFQGFATGSGFIGGAKGMKDGFTAITKRAWKIVYVSGAVTLGIGGAYYGASSSNDNEFRFWKWDFSKPGVYNAILVTGPTSSFHVTKPLTIKKAGKSILKEIKSGFPTIKKAVFTLLKRGEFDLLKAQVTSTIPTSQDNMVGLLKVTKFNFDDNSVAWTYMLSTKEDFSQLAKLLATASGDVLDGISGDFDIGGTYTNLEPFSPRMNLFLEHVAEAAFAKLERSAGLYSGNDTMLAETFFMKNGSIVAVTGKSGFLFDGPVILIEREFHPDIFNRLEGAILESKEESQNNIKANRTARFLTAINEQHMLSPDSKPKKSHLAQDPNNFDELNKLTDIEEEECEFFGLSKMSPFIEITKRGSNCLASTGMEGKRTVLTEPGWEKQSDPFSYSLFNYNNPGHMFSNFTTNDSTSSFERVRRSVERDSFEHSSSQWTANDPTLPSATSSGNKGIGFINQGIRMFKGLLNGFLKPQGQTNTGNSEPFEKTNTNSGFGKFQGRNGQWTSEWKKCVPWVLSEENGYVDGFTCFTKEGIIQVTPKALEEIAPGAIMSPSSQDTYEDCQFFKSGGMGSAYCKGQKSNVRYMAFIDERPFDRVNDNLLLMGLVLHFYQVWKSEDDFEEEIKPQLIPIEKEKLQSCKEEMEGIRQAMEVLRKHTNDPFYMDWAWNIFEDRVTELETFEIAGSAAPGKMEEFEDNLSALKEEIYEGYLLSSQ